MKRRLVLTVVAALAGVGCGDPPERAQAKRAQPEPQPKFAVGQDIRYPGLIATDGPGPRFFICEVAQRIVEGKLKIPAGGGRHGCTGDESQVQDLGGGNYAINSWLEVAHGRADYNGEAVLTEENGVPKRIRITRLDLAGGAQ